MKKVAKLFGKGKAAWKRVMFIDPGVRNMGYAFWPELHRLVRPNKRRLILPSNSGLVTAPRNIPWMNAVLEHQVPWLTSMIRMHDITTLVVEFTEVWATSEVSMASATKGDLQKLTFMIGAMVHSFTINTGLIPTLISPRDWKGTMPKDVMKRRLRIAVNAAGAHKQYSEHEADAVAMGVSVQGLL